jgi:hypothetical protein
MPLLHPLDQICPRCGRQKITYARPRQKSDLYVCNPATGGCRGIVIHSRANGSCGTRVLLSFCRLGDFRPCAPQSAG